MSKKKVLFLIESMSPGSGGTAVEIQRLSMLLKDESIKLSVISLTPKIDALLLDNNVNYISLSDSFFLSIGWWQNVLILAKVIKQHDVVFSTGVWGPIDGCALRLAYCFKNMPPLYIRVCGMLEPYIMARSPIKKAIAQLLYVRSNLRKSSGIIVNSVSEAENLKKIGLGYSKIMVIPNGIQLNTKQNILEKKAEFGIGNNKLVILYLGRIHPKKGLHFLLEAIGKLPTENQEFVLLVAGEYSDNVYKNELNSIIERYKLQEIIIFSGLVTGANKDLHFNIADVFILPSESEGLPNAVLEALSYGIPSIITSGCNIPEVSEFNAGLVVDLTVENLVYSLEWVVEQFRNNELDKFSNNAKNLIGQKFSPNACRVTYTNIINKL